MPLILVSIIQLPSGAPVKRIFRAVAPPSTMSPASLTMRMLPGLADRDQLALFSLTHFHWV
ncbi:hypothetical protein D3C75_1095100 [compost metagenome]